jgi:hypothetical protein
VVEAKSEEAVSGKVSRTVKSKEPVMADRKAIYNLVPKTGSIDMKKLVVKVVEELGITEKAAVRKISAIQNKGFISVEAGG